MMAVVAADQNAEAISQQIAHIMTMGQGELQSAWVMHCRGKPPAFLPRSISGSPAGLSCSGGKSW